MTDQRTARHWLPNHAAKPVGLPVFSTPDGEQVTIWLLSDGDFLVVAPDITEACEEELIDGANRSDSERIVKVPREALQAILSLAMPKAAPE